MTTHYIITSDPSVGQEHQYTLDLPPAEPTPDATPVELQRTEHLKRLTSDQIARSFIVNGSDELRKLSDKLLDCSESVSLRASGAVHSHGRCKHRLCALCSSIKASTWQREIDRMMDHLKYDLIEDSQHPDETALVALKITLNAGQTCPATELKTVIRDVLHTLWPRLLRLSAVKPHLEGAIRATEVTVSKEPMRNNIPLMNPHIHGTILLRVPPSERATWRTWLDELALTIGHYWVGAVSRRLKKLSIDRPITLSSQEIIPITAQTTEHLSNWMKYGVKGAVTSLAKALHKEDYTVTALHPIARIWAEIYRAIKGIRLIATSGSLSDSLDDAREELRSEKELSSPPRREPAPDVTHRWSYPNNTFIPIDHWDAEVDKPPYFRTKMYQFHYRDAPDLEERKRAIAQQRKLSEQIYGLPDDAPVPRALRDELFLYTQESQGTLL